MPADPLPWSERLRRRNGLTPAGAYVDECTVTEVDGTPVAIRGSGTFTERDQEMFAEVVRAAKRLYEAETTAAEPRCDLFDLPTTMCHHCQETHNAQP